MLDPSRDSLADLTLFLIFPVVTIGGLVWMFIL